MSPSAGRHRSMIIIESLPVRQMRQRLPNFGFAPSEGGNKLIIELELIRSAVIFAPPARAAVKHLSLPGLKQGAPAGKA